MKTILTLLSIISSFMLTTSFTRCQPRETVSLHEETVQNEILDRLRLKADSAFIYAKQKGFDTKYCLLVDFSIHSGRDRLFVWDFTNDTIKYAGLCCHGYGNKANRSTQRTPRFSNVAGSLCSSLGRYKIGARSYSQWGINIHYKLHGLDDTNSNAYKRIIVLHSHSPVPDSEIYPYHLPLGYSQGCPVVSDSLMRELDDILKDKKKPVLLWIY